MRPTFFLPQYWLTWFGLGLLRLISSLPWPMVAKISDGLGAILYKLAGSRREIARKNIRSCFPELEESEVSVTLLRSFQLSLQAALFTGVGWWASESRYKKLIECDASSIDELIKQGKNVIVLTPHFMGLETAGIYLSIDRQFMTMYQYTKNALVHYFVRQKRSRFGGGLVERKEPLRKMLKLLKSGVPLYYLPDQDAGKKGMFVPFFGIQASTFDMLGKLVKLTDAVVVPCSVEIKEKGQGMCIRFHEPLVEFPTKDDYHDVALMNQKIEELVAQMPEQYLWMHKRFKTRPEGETPFY